MTPRAWNRTTIGLLAAGAGLLGALVTAEGTAAQGLEGAWEVTAYCYTGNRTASGTWPQRGTVAAPRGVPFGTALYIEGYGGGRVEDRGGAIVGRRLDLYMPSCAEAIRWGRRWVRVSHFPPPPLAEVPAPYAPPAPQETPAETHEDTAEWSEANQTWTYRRVTRDAAGNVVAELSGTSVVVRP